MPARVAVVFLSIAALSVPVRADAPDSKSAKKEDRKPAPKDDKPLMAIVFLLKEHRPLKQEALEAAFRKAFPKAKVGGDDADFSIVLGKGTNGIAVVRNNPVAEALLINSFPRPYWGDAAAMAERVPNPEIKDIIRSHKAWLSVDHLGGKWDPEKKDDVYRLLGKVMAELTGEDCMAVLVPEISRLRPWNGDIPEKLRGDDPLSAAGYTRDPIIHVAPDDPAMKAAEAEARKTWPKVAEEFRAGKRPGLAAKFRFTDGDKVEFMWVRVGTIDGETVAGKLANAPGIVKNVKLDDDVKCRAADLNDWMYFDSDENPVGGFTIKVLAEKAKEAKRRK